MRVTQADGTQILPKKSYAEKIRSQVKMSILEQYQVDIMDKGKFPLMEKRWRAFISELVRNNRSEIQHKEEVSPHTMAAIWELLKNAKAAFESRGMSGYQEKLWKIPLSWQSKLNYILQYGMQFILTLYEVRRGRENLDQLRKSDFETREDDVYNFKYIR